MCPTCGRSVGIKSYDPVGRPLDVMAKSFRGLGHGKGFKVSAEESILHTNPDHAVLTKLRERVANVYDMFFEGDDVEELIDRINEALGTSHETLLAASEDAISRLQDFMEEDEPDEEEAHAAVRHEVNEEESIAAFDHEVGSDTDDDGIVLVEDTPLSELDYEIQRGEREEES